MVQHTEVNDMNTAIGDLNDSRDEMGGAGSSQSSALAFAGFAPSLSAKTEAWNGSSWTEVNDLSTARDVVNGAGTGVGALCSGGFTPSATGATEEWTAPDVVINTLTTS
jgi:hypothetical protein